MKVRVKTKEEILADKEIIYINNGYYVFQDKNDVHFLSDMKQYYGKTVTIQEIVHPFWSKKIKYITIKDSLYAWYDWMLENSINSMLEDLKI